MPALIDLVGTRFGRLIVLSRSPKQARDIAWECSCDCGKNVTVSGRDLRYGDTKSCGCYQRERAGQSSRTHGMAGRREYRIWKAMRRRCRNPKDTAYASYGGRGIEVCDRWNDFARFYADMGRCPPAQTIERKNSSGPYSPDNCIWASRLDQSRNRRSNVSVTIGDRTYVLSEACELYGMSYGTVQDRIKNGWPAALAVTTPTMKTGRPAGA